MVAEGVPQTGRVGAVKLCYEEDRVPQEGRAHGPAVYSNIRVPIKVNGVVYPVTTVPNQEVRILSFYLSTDAKIATGAIVFAQIGIVTYAPNSNPRIQGKVVYRYRHSGENSGDDGENWITLN